MPSVLLLRVEGCADLDSQRPQATNSNFTVTLEGCVTSAVVSACSAALDKLAKSVLSLKSALPALRFQGGQWQFVTSCSAVFHSTIMCECFVAPINRLGYRLENPAWELSAKEREKHLVGYALKTPHVKIFVTDEDCEAYYPGGGSLVGGSGETVKVDPERSLELAADTVFSLAGRDLLVFGVGWSPLRNKTYEMLMGQNKAPDIDLVVYLANRWGEPLYKLCAKEMRTMPTPANVSEQLRFNHQRCYDSAVKISNDSVGGASAGDDERAAIFLPGLDMNVCSILVTVSIAANARDFNYVQNVYVRLLDVETHTAEIELCRFQLPDAGTPDDHKSAVLLRLDRTGASADLAQPVDSKDWELRTVGGFCLSHDPARPDVVPGDIVSGLRYGDTNVSLKATEWSIGSMVQGGAYKFNIDRIQDAAQHCTPIAVSFSRLVEGGKMYEAVFDADPTQTIRFAPQHLRGNILSLSGVSTQEGIPMVQSVAGNLKARLVQGQLSPYLGLWVKTPQPDRIVIHDIRAYIPASDAGGTTDAYCQVYYNKLQSSTTSQMIESIPKIIAKSQLLKKVPCPSIVTWPEFAVEIPIDCMNGVIPKCIIKVSDKDFNPLGFMAGMGSKGAAVASAADDTLLMHKLNLAEFVCRDASKMHDFVVMPDYVGDIMNSRSNSGFTKQMVTLLVKVTLLLPGEKHTIATCNEPLSAEDKASAAEVARNKAKFSPPLRM